MRPMVQQYRYDPTSLHKPSLSVDELLCKAMVLTLLLSRLEIFRRLLSETYILRISALRTVGNLLLGPFTPQPLHELSDIWRATDAILE